ncbi:hypothetical protein A2V82_11115 [candidate division KSB1 bacterium RBG_16_48_16]|nr:MAG: hypothetical protein A2V82_11115 [candidate division KSB1 bacterium RBG_16_48_16]
MSELFVKIKDKQRGPYSSKELRELVHNGDFGAHDYVYDNDRQQWVRAGQSEHIQSLFEKSFIPEHQRTVFAVGGGKGGVGKTSLTASIGIALAALGYEVVIVDADLGGANLHTCMGILEPEKTFYDFYTLQCEALEDILLETPVENLRLISGACGTLGLANPRYTQKLRFISELKKIAADFIILDLGAGASYNVIDFFVAAEQGIVVTTPEPMAIQETFNFIKISLFRKLLRLFRDKPAVLTLIEKYALSSPGRMNSSMDEVLADVRRLDVEASSRMEGVLDKFRPKLILNMVHSHNETREGAALRTAVEELLAINMDYLGYVEYDDSVRKAVKELKPFIIANPKSRASRSVAQLVSVSLLGKNGWKGLRERKKMIRNIRSDASEYPQNSFPESDVICSVKCFYWGDCDYQNGGHPCPVRHLDPIFRKQS